MLCQKCYGSGKLLGNGMMHVDCSCLYDDDIEEGPNAAPKPVQIDKRTKAYREAITKIMHVNEISKAEAEKIFEEEFYRLV